MTGFDHESLDRILPATPGPADWSDVVRRSGAQQRRHRLVLVLAAVALVAVGTASALGMRALFLDKGFIGLPPVGATPSTPARGTLVASLIGRKATVGSLIRMWVYADGRLIWVTGESRPHGANKLTTGFLEQHLTAKGVERLRSEIVSTGLFDHDLALASRRFVWGTITVRAGRRLVRVKWQNPDMYAADPEMRAYKPASRQQARALGRLDSLLAHPSSWLPAGAWADRRIRAYVPSRFATCYEVLPKALSEPPREPSVFLDLAPSAVGDLLRARHTTRHEGARGWGGGPFYPYHYDCARVTTEEARALVKAFDDAGAEQLDPAHVLGYRFRVPGKKRETADISFDPLLPHGERSSLQVG